MTYKLHKDNYIAAPKLPFYSSISYDRSNPIGQIAIWSIIHTNNLNYPTNIGKTKCRPKQKYKINKRDGWDGFGGELA